MSVATWPRAQLDPAHPTGWPRHAHRGRLIVVEGVDGSGRATQLNLLAAWLQVEGYGVVRTTWNSSKLVSRTIHEARRQNTLTPLTYSILHATDVAERQEAEIVPALKAGYIVLADRYVFTALARDSVRGVELDWLLNLFSFAVRPDLAIYLRVPADVSLERTLGVAGEVSADEAAENAAVRGALESFRQFQERVVASYERLVEPFDLYAVDATLPIRAQQQLIRREVAALLDGME